jgi:hypothetical protein
MSEKSSGLQCVGPRWPPIDWSNEDDGATLMVAGGACLVDQGYRKLADVPLLSQLMCIIFVLGS